MARNLTFDLDQAMITGVRKPAYKLEVFDLRSTASDATPTTINDVVQGNALPAIVGPRDFTDDVLRVDVQERAGDFTGDGVASSSVRFVVVDADGTLDPVNGSNGRWLKQGNVVRLTEGDMAVPEDEWVLTFTGVISGQPGQSRNRTTRTSEITVQCFDRAARFLKVVNTSQNFVQNTAYTSMVDTIATDDMGLASSELNIPSFSTAVTQHLAAQLIEESPLQSISQIMFLEGFMPRFEGDGKLGATNGITTKGSARLYDEDENVVTRTRPLLTLDGINEVIIIGLSSDLTKITQPQQVLANATVVTGFFSKGDDVDVFWSDDRTLQADNTQLRVLQSINGFLPIGDESYSPFTQVDGAAMGGRIKVRTGFAGPLMLAIITGAYIGASSIPDTSFGIAPTLGGPVFSTTVVPTGKIAQAVVLSGGLLLMSQIGQGRYQVVGEPFEHVFAEIRALARVAGTPTADLRPITIENQFINTQAQADTVALRTLKRLRAQQNKRRFEMVHDLLLEPDDIFELSDGSRHMIESINRTLVRDDSGGRAVVNAFEVTSGVRP